MTAIPPGTGPYYDLLSRWTAWARHVGYGGGRETLTVHRALADPRRGGQPTATRLHDLLFEALPPLDDPRVFDAGCGLGGTMLDLASRMDGTFTGVTLSVSQAATGREAIAAAKLEERVSIQVGNYDSPPPGPFDLVIAIESLAHSPDPARSLRVLVGCMAPRGLLVVVDDMPVPGAPATPDLVSFREGWLLPVLWNHFEYGAAFTALGLDALADRDLTPELRPRSLPQIARLTALNRLLRSLSPTAGLRTMLDSYLGGLALERLYRRGLMNYRLLVARRRPGACTQNRNV